VAMSCAENEFASAVNLRIVPAVKFQGVERDGIDEGRSLWLRELLQGFSGSLTLLVESITQLAQVVWLNPLLAAKVFQGRSIVNTDHGVVHSMQVEIPDKMTR
jgi:hypothetical protein